jgi:hypothetical protein
MHLIYRKSRAYLLIIRKMYRTKKYWKFISRYEFWIENKEILFKQYNVKYFL